MCHYESYINIILVFVHKLMLLIIESINIINHIVNLKIINSINIII